MDCKVIKIGGKLIEDSAMLDSLCNHLALFKKPFIIVHGGGALAGKFSRRLNIPEVMIDGRRVTDEATLQVTVMTYSGLVNKILVGALQQRGVNAGGFSGCDLQLVRAHKRISNDIDWGYVGDIDKVNSDMLIRLLEMGITPVLSSITYSTDGELLNSNADSVASAVAEAMALAGYNSELIICFDKKGVLKEAEDESSVIPVLSMSLYKKYKREGIFYAGMLPKLENAFRSIAVGVSSVRLLHPDDLGNSGAGTLCEA